MASCWDEFGLRWWSVEVGISGGGEVGFWLWIMGGRGDFWIGFGCGRVECNLGSLVRMGEEFWEVSEVFWGLNCCVWKRRKNCGFWQRKGVVLGSLRL